MRGETILVVDDELLIRWAVKEQLAAEGYTVCEAASAREAMEMIDAREPDLVLLDQLLGDETGIAVLESMRDRINAMPVIMITAVDSSETAVKAMKLGAFDYITKPINFEELHLLIQKALEQTKSVRRYRALLQAQQTQGGFCGIIGTSAPMQQVIHAVTKLAQASSSMILITGESGTGKEVVARAIHALSDRAGEALVTVNCASIPRTLMESELFGHEKGAFTDARSRRKGMFELADTGTLFLDEIGDLPLELQAALLRVLEQRVFRRVGGEFDIAVDLRIIAATNQNLEELIRKGLFRQDLYYRLNVMRIDLPPLRDRGDDVLLLAMHFLDEFNVKFRKRFKGLSEETQELFRRYSWPGNVRELRNIIERATFMDDGEYIFSHAVQLGHMHSLHAPAHHEPPAVAGPDASLVDIEKAAIVRALDACGHNQSQAARMLHISRDTLRYRMKKYGLE